MTNTLPQVTKVTVRKALAALRSLGDLPEVEHLAAGKRIANKAGFQTVRQLEQFAQQHQLNKGTIKRESYPNNTPQKDSH